MANFLSVLLVSAVLFIVAGMSPLSQLNTKREVLRRFGLAVVGFVLITGFLTNSLIGIVKERGLEMSVKKVLSGEFSQMHATSLQSSIHELYENKLHVLATVYSPEIVPPDDVKRIEQALSQHVKLPAELVVRSVIVNDVHSKGFTGQVIDENLNGLFLSKEMLPWESKIMLAEQALRENISSYPGLQLMEVELGDLPRGPVVIAAMRGVIELSSGDVKELENAVRDILKEPNIQLLVRFTRTDLFDRRGKYIYGWSSYGLLTPEKEKVMDRIDMAVKEEFRQFSDAFPVKVHYQISDKNWRILIETVGARPMSPDDIAGLEGAISDKAKQEVTVSVWFRPEAVVTGDGYTSLEDFTMENVGEREKEILKRFKLDLD